MIKIFKIITINLIIFFLLLIVIELIFGSWFKKNNIGSLLIPKQQSNLITNFPYKSEDVGIYTRDQYGFRANNYNLKDINILILGGSTTEEREVDDQKIWTKIFEKNLKKNLKVLNAGIGGQTSLGHKEMFNLWFNKFDTLSPDFIVVFLGINDALYLVENVNGQTYLNITYSDKFEAGRSINNSNRDELLNIMPLDKTIQYIKNNSIIHTLYLIVKGNLLSYKYGLNYNDDIKTFDPHVTKSPDIVKLDEVYLGEFENYYHNNLLKIYNYANEYKSDLIFVTQSVSSKHWIKKYLNIVNNFTRSFCKIEKIKCIDLDKKIRGLSNEFFYDGIHTDPVGSKIIGEFIAKEFNKLNLE